MAATRHPPPGRIDRYLHDLLKGAARDELERHFMACQECFERLRVQLGSEFVDADAPRDDGAK